MTVVLTAVAVVAVLNLLAVLVLLVLLRRWLRELPSANAHLTINERRETAGLATQLVPTTFVSTATDPGATARPAWPFR